jgi:hypothetical protein
LIAVFIEFRQIRDNQWKFLDAIRKELGLQDQQQIKALLEAGRMMVLMDGFDEVPTWALRRTVQKQLGEVAKDYPKNRFIMTCRTQIMASIPDGFASVEVADFSDPQVEAFVKNWFQANGQDERAVISQREVFKSAMAKNAALKELRITPVLLGLMCLVLQDEGEIPTQASLLYERGIKLLLRKWNDEKDIPEWEIGTANYRNLDVEQKENLLIQISAKKFDNPKNFVIFEEDELIQQIVGQLNLPNRSEGKATLKAIEAQHGLLIERADELWSFSHLTFQEYFTTKWLLSLSPKNLSQKITDKQWQNVVQQLVKSQGRSDRLLRLIKQALDQMLSQDPNLQAFLIWLDNKAQSVQRKYGQAAIRAFYFHLARDRALILARALNLNLDHDLGLAHDCSHYRALGFDLNHDLAIARALTLDLNLDCDRDFTLNRVLARTLDCDLDLALTNKLKQLKEEVPNSDNYTHSRQWWQSHGSAWIADLRQAIIEHRNIGHDWQFTAEQEQQLQHYDDINQFLVELLKADNAATPEVRQEIEDNLLLPIAELKRRLPEQYGD